MAPLAELIACALASDEAERAPLESFPPEIAICRLYGGGGNRTRVTSLPETPRLQRFCSSRAWRPSPCDASKAPRNLASRAAVPEAMTPHRRFSDQSPDHIRGGCGCPHPCPAVPRGSLACPAVVLAGAGGVYRACGVGRDERDVEPSEPRVLPDPVRDVGERGWPRRPRHGVVRGATVARVPDLAARRRLVAGVVHGRQLRAAVRA